MNPRTTGRRQFLRFGRDLLLVSSASSWVSCRGDGTRSGPPNIVLFLVDDLGAADSSIAGSRFFRTPGLARMAAEGMRFSDATSPSPLCSASRASILTGRYPHRVGITGAITCVPPCQEVASPSIGATAPDWQRVVTPSFRTHLPLGETTIAEMLRGHGYATAHIGKWHLGGDDYSPAKQGYGTVVGGSYHWSTGSHVAPYGLPDLADAEEGELLEDRLTTEAERFIDRNRNRPFFLALFHYGVHTPLDGSPDAIAEHAARVDPADGQRNPAYGAQVEACDRSLARVLDRLDALGLSEETLVVVTSDNGGLLLESSDGLLVPVTNNAPFRGGKAHIYEGGTRVPFVARWVGTIPPGSTSSTPVSGCDLMATFRATSGLPVDVATSGDGANLLPVLRGEKHPAVRPIYVHFPHYIPGPRWSGVEVDAQPFWALPASSVRLGREKLIRVYGEGATRGGRPGSDRFELYDLVDDPGESNDLANDRPERVTALAAMLDAHLEESGALIPKPNPAYRPSFEGYRIANDARASLASGVLRVVATGPDPYLLSPTVAYEESVRVVVRARSAESTTIDLFHVTRSFPAFDLSRRQSVALPATTGFTELFFDVAPDAGDSIRRFRLDIGLSGAVVELESIRVVRVDDPQVELARFPFDSASDGSYGGAIAAVADCTVACSAGALHVQIDGANARVATDPLMIFGPLTLRIRLRSNGTGECSIGAALDVSLEATTSVAIPVVHDDVYRDYVVSLDLDPSLPVRRLVLALGGGPATVELGHLRASQRTARGESIVGAWEFGG